MDFLSFVFYMVYLLANSCFEEKQANLTNVAFHLTIGSFPGKTMFCTRGRESV